MSHRVVVETSGVSWEIWEVEPTLIEKRDAPPDAPSTGERRRVRSARLRVSPAMRDGWLAMRSATERRRIAPIPAGWADLDDAALLTLVARAEVIGVPRRLIE
ncbi:MAG: hypothetical protein JWN79_1895 [Gemmatimonadetes bacterium]|jgi:hypothetical protein|nr:hypothetical protein [Gemmatimonadota bacterium]